MKLDLTNLSIDALRTMRTERDTELQSLLSTMAGQDDPAAESLDRAEEIAGEHEHEGETVPGELSQIDQAIEAAEAAEAGDAPTGAERLAALQSQFSGDGDEGEEGDGEEGAEGAEGGEGAETTEASQRDPKRKPPPQPTMSADQLAAAVGAAVDAVLEKRAPVTTQARTSATTAKALSVAQAARKTPRPPLPEGQDGTEKLAITAAANVPGINAGDTITDLNMLGKAVVNMTKSFPTPNGDGKSVDLRKYQVAQIALPFTEEFQVNENDSDGRMLDVMTRAGDEMRISGDNGALGLVAASIGWCSPSETLYDLPADESTDGMLSLPEMQINRGGIRFTRGPQFADFYANAGFIQTEAQAIADTVKPCYTVTCPSFVEARLDAVGLCIKVPILTNAAWPELTNRFTSGTLVAHQHMVNANVIGRVVTDAGAVRTFTGMATGSTLEDLLSALQLMANQRRQVQRLAFNRSMEVGLPFWVLNVLRDDMSRRNGRPIGDPVTDAMIDAEFRVRNFNVQWLYDWQDLDLVDAGGTAGVDERNEYRTTFDGFMYPAGTYVKGVSDVINLSAVYDAAELAHNVFTGLFAEQGLLVARRQYAGDNFRISIDSSGRTGRQDLADARA